MCRQQQRLTVELIIMVFISYYKRVRILIVSMQNPLTKFSATGTLVRDSTTIATIVVRTG